MNYSVKNIVLVILLACYIKKCEDSTWLCEITNCSNIFLDYVWSLYVLVFNLCLGKDYRCNTEYLKWDTGFFLRSYIVICSVSCMIILNFSIVQSASFKLKDKKNKINRSNAVF